jgi:hypothetical protein
MRETPIFPFFKSSTLLIVRFAPVEIAQPEECRLASILHQIKDDSY